MTKSMLLLTASLILAPAARAQTAAPATAVPQSGSTVPTEAPPQVGQSQAAEAESQSGLADIIVTAQQRDENLQKAALPVDVVSGADLISSGIRGLETLGRVVPSVVTLGGASSNTVFIRGIGNFAFLGSADPAVAFNYDGVYIGRAGGTFGTFYDLERVEVLTGPQGTLYGRNATGGAINVLPVQPRLGENSGYVTAGYGNYDQVDVEGAANIGLGSNAGLRLSGIYLKRDGYLQDGLQADHSIGGRAQLKVELTPDLTVRIEGDFARQRGDRVAGGSTYLGYYLPNAAGYTITPSNLPLDQGIFSPNQQAFRTANGFAGSLAGRRLDPLAVTPYQDNDIYGIAYHVDYRTSFGTFSLIPAWRHSRRDNISTDSAALVGVTQDANQYSVEARLASEQGKRLDYILGAYYFSERVDENQHATTGAQFGENLNRYTTHSPAAYGRLTLHATDWLRLVGGIRYTDDRKSFTGTQAALAVVCTVPAACPTAPLLPYTRSIATQPNAPSVNGGRVTVAPGVIVARADATLASTIDESKVTYRGAAEIDLGPRSLLYGSVETGYRSGGFNGASNYGPENITAWTIGSKNRFFSNRLQLNVELFNWKYRGQQLTYVGVDPSGRIGATTQNIGRSTIRGVEVEAQGRLTQTTTLTVNAQYLDATYDQFGYSSPVRPLSGCSIRGTGPFTVDCSGQPALNSPKWTVNLGGNQVFPIGDYDLTVSADTQYRSSRYVNFEYIAPELVGPTWTTNAQISVGPNSGRFLLSVFIRNIEDDRFPIYAGPATGSNLIIAIPSAPRTFGGRLSVRFLMHRRWNARGAAPSIPVSSDGADLSPDTGDPDGPTEHGGNVISVVALLTGVMVLEGLDLTLASLAAPVLAVEWHLSKSGLAPLLAAALIGMTVGALVGSWVADRFGRRPVILGSVAIFAVGTIACGLADGATMFAALRFASGLGFGAATPSVAALMSESVPRRHLGRALGVMTIGIPVGGAIAALATSWLLPHFGWRFCFVGAGILCLAFAILLYRRLSESPVFWAARSVEAAVGRATLEASRPDKDGGLRLLFAAGRRRFNLGLYVAVFASALAIYASAGWLTVNLTELGLPLALALRASAVVGIAAVVGSLGAGWVVARLGSRATMLLAVLLGCAAGSMLAWTPGTLGGQNLESVVIISLALFGLFTGGIQPSIYLVAARAYPTQIRSIGLGVSSVVGRAGAVLSSFLGGAMLALDGPSAFYAGIAALAVCTGIGVVLIDRHLPGSGHRRTVGSAPEVRAGRETTSSAFHNADV